MNIIDFKHITVDYGNGPVLHNITLQVEEGEHTVILGSNGSGKSTLMKLFSADLYPSAKYPYVKRILGQERWNIWELKKQLGMITHDLHYTFANQARSIMGLDLVISGFHSSIGVFSHQGITQKQKAQAREAMDLLDIGHLATKMVQQMSTGELRRAIIARAMVHQPKALLLDEPTSGLDIKAQMEFVTMIRKLAKHVTILLITHHIEEIFPEISQVVLLKQGNLFGHGEKERLLTSEQLSQLFDTSLEVSCDERGWYRVSPIIRGAL